MKHFNLLYIIVILIGVFIFWYNLQGNKDVIFFYGFAENKETEINFNYPVVVEKLWVSPGEFVKKDQPLVSLKRIKAKDILEDQSFRIDELRARERTWIAEQEGEIEIIKNEKDLKSEEFRTAIQNIEQQKKLKESLYSDLNTIDSLTPDLSTYDDKINSIHREWELEIKLANQEISNIQELMKLGRNPYRSEIQRLEAEIQFEQDSKVIDVEIKAPFDGLIGNISCKEAEHITSFKTLINLYESNPSLVKAYVHEDLILEVSLQDTFRISSTKDASISEIGRVTGLGSRIVEIPDRLRKMADIKTYGREVLISLPEKNNFLQKEKVSCQLLTSKTE